VAPPRMNSRTHEWLSSPTAIRRSGTSFYGPVGQTKRAGRIGSRPPISHRGAEALRREIEGAERASRQGV
jgi:hypothetical protein